MCDQVVSGFTTSVAYNWFVIKPMLHGVLHLVWVREREGGWGEGIEDYSPQKRCSLCVLSYTSNIPK